MTQYLPFEDFNWIDEEQLKWLNALDESFPKNKIRELIKQLEIENKSGFFKVMLSYPSALHEDDNLYPIAPERSTVQLEYVSRYTHKLNTITGYKTDSKTPMPLQTLHTKDYYFLHAKSLLLCMDHGLEFIKICPRITFKQSPIMEDYINLNTRLRNKGKSVIEKELYKLLNNAIYGKTFENLMHYSYLKLVDGEKEYLKVASMTGFKGSVFVQDDFMISKGTS